jgi:hypothetical protein
MSSVDNNNCNNNSTSNTDNKSLSHLGCSSIQLDKYVRVLNANCPSLDEYRVKWTPDDLNPEHIRNYCKIDKNGINGICWSCSDYINQYKNELEKWDLGPGKTLALLAELKLAHMELDKKLERILSLLSGSSGKQDM